MSAPVLFSRFTAVLLAAAIGVGCESRQPSQPTPGVVTVTSISPSTGPAAGATGVTIAGTGFEPGATVTFNGVAATVIVLSPVALTATTPPHAAGRVDVVVINPNGTGATLRGGFAYSDPVPPPSPPGPLALTSVSPNVGSTAGGAQVFLNGVNFKTGATVTFDGIAVPPAIGNATVMIVHPPAHSAGRVDLVVTNPDGQTARQDFTYAPPESFDFNGEWDAYVGENLIFRFAIRNNVLTSVTCGTSAPLTPAPPPVVVNGAFSFSGADVGSMSGHLVAASQAVGTIDMPVCGAITWSADRHQ
jgi:hypothetical protein